MACLKVTNGTVARTEAGQAVYLTVGAVFEEGDPLVVQALTRKVGGSCTLISKGEYDKELAEIKAREEAAERKKLEAAAAQAQRDADIARRDYERLKALADENARVASERMAELKALNDKLKVKK